MFSVRSVGRAFAGLVVASPMFAGAQAAPKVNAFGNPARVTPAPTTAAITPRDLQIRLYQFADDSMQGRQVGRVGNMKGTDMIAAELKRLGLVPAGDNGTYFQVLPYHVRKYTNHSRLTVDGNPVAWNAEWLAVPGARAPKAITNVEVIYGGVAGDPSTLLPPAQGAGKFVVLAAAAPRAPQPGGRGGGFAPPPSPFPDAVAVATVDLDALTPAQRTAINEPTVASTAAGGRGGRGGGAPNAPVDSIALLKAQLAALTPAANLRLGRD